MGTTASTSLADRACRRRRATRTGCGRGTRATTLGPYSNVASATTGAAPPPPPATLWPRTRSTRGRGRRSAELSGNGNAGTVQGASWTTAGKFGAALSFNGSSARVRVADAASLDLTSGVTVEAWVYPAAAQSGWRAVVQKEVDSYLLHASSGAGALRPAAGVTVGGRGADGVRAERVAGGGVVASGDDVRRVADAAVRERHAGGERAADGGDRADGEPAVDRWEQPVRGVLQRADRRGARLSGGADARRRSRPTWPNPVAPEPECAQARHHRSGRGCDGDRRRPSTSRTRRRATSQASITSTSRSTASR